MSSCRRHSHTFCLRVCVCVKRIEWNSNWPQQFSHCEMWNELHSRRFHIDTLNYCFSTDFSHNFQSFQFSVFIILLTSFNFICFHFCMTLGKSFCVQKSPSMYFQHRHMCESSFCTSFSVPRRSKITISALQIKAVRLNILRVYV